MPNRGTQEPQKDFQGQWQPCRPDTVGGFSAVGYFFGRQLHQTLDVPIGLINDSWGGSACEAWIRRDILAADEKYAPCSSAGKNSRKTSPSWNECGSRRQSQGRGQATSPQPRATSRT